MISWSVLWRRFEAMIGSRMCSKEITDRCSLILLLCAAMLHTGLTKWNGNRVWLLAFEFCDLDFGHEMLAEECYCTAFYSHLYSTAVTVACGDYSFYGRRI